MPLSVALIEDHAVLRDGLRAVFATAPDLALVAEASDAESAYACVEQTAPDVVVLDISLPGVSGLIVARELLRRDARRRILFLSMHRSDDMVAEAFAAGGLGYVTKDQPAACVIEGIRQVGRGARFVSPDVAPAAGLPGRGAGGEGALLRSLSRREREVLELILQGHSNEKIAEILVISRRTVETHRAHLHQKLQLRSVVELFKFAARHGLLVE